jgi:hypothetical protein
MNRDMKENNSTLEKILNSLIILPSMKENISSFAKTLIDQRKEHITTITKDVETIITKLSLLEVIPTLN